MQSQPRCARCQTPAHYAIDPADSEVLDCDRCGHVGLTETNSTQPLAGKKKRPLWGWGSAAFLCLCTLIGGLVFVFLKASGEGWSDPRGAAIQTPLCQWMNCGAHPIDVQPRIWQTETLNIAQTSDTSSQIQAKLTPLTAIPHPWPNLRLMIVQGDGDRLSRTFEPLDYLSGQVAGQLRLDIQIPAQQIDRVEWQAIDTGLKTTAQVLPPR